MTTQMKSGKEEWGWQIDKLAIQHAASDHKGGTGWQIDKLAIQLVQVITKEERGGK
jgi:hypothetical protein